MRPAANALLYGTVATKINFLYAKLISGSENPITILSQTLETVIIRLASCCEVSSACWQLLLFISRSVRVLIGTTGWQCCVQSHIQHTV